MTGRTLWFNAAVGTLPAVRYARVGSVSLAYQTWGDGPATIVAIPPMAQNIELTWERPEYRRMLDRLGSFASVLHFDKRGTGASDRTPRMATMDERVEDLHALMDAAEIDQAHLLGVSEGGPVALAFAATYPRRVSGVIMIGAGARMVPDETDAVRDRRRTAFALFVDRWGTDESITLDVFAPTAAADPDYRAWQPRYERQSATPAAMRELVDMIETIDVRPLLGSITAPVLILHRSGDRVVPIELAREVAAAIPAARLVELPGDDHMAQVGDSDAWLDHVSQFTTGTVHPKLGTATDAIPEIRIMGGFNVTVASQDVPVGAWGSRRARQLCKRLAVEAGQPVPREQLIELLWPEEDDPSKLGPRLSVLLSNIRRVLGGGIVADRAAVRLDLDRVRLDVQRVYGPLERGDDAAAVSAYRGPILPEDAYEDWAIAARDRLAFSVIGARRRLAAAAASAERPDEVVLHASAILELDPYDERAHELLVRALVAARRQGDASRANARYRAHMAELGVRPQTLLE